MEIAGWATLYFPRCKVGMYLQDGLVICSLIPRMWDVPVPDFPAPGSPIFLHIVGWTENPSRCKGCIPYMG
jgi:hypothetical protein